jgi:hypothetical protein
VDKPEQISSKTKREPRRKVVQGEKLRGADKVARIPVKVIPTETMPRKPDWIRVKMPVSPEVSNIKKILRTPAVARFAMLPMDGLSRWPKTNPGNWPRPLPKWGLNTW